MQCSNFKLVLQSQSKNKRKVLYYYPVPELCTAFSVPVSIVVIFSITARSAIAEWDLDETKAGGPFKEILEYDILVNCILLMEVQNT